MDAIIRGDCILLVLDDLVIEVHCVDWNTILPSIVLESTSQESVSKVELVNHIGGWHAILEPVVEELNSFF